MTDGFRASQMRDPFLPFYLRVAREEGVLLRYVDNDPGTVRLVERNAGRALTAYELLGVVLDQQFDQQTEPEPE